MPFETQSRVENTQTATGDNHTCSFEDHKRDLIIGQVTAEPAVQFRCTKDRSDEDEESRDAQSWFTLVRGTLNDNLFADGSLTPKKPSPFPAAPRRCHTGLGLSLSPEPPQVIDSKRHERRERCNLRCQPRDHDVDSSATEAILVLSGRGSDGPACSLQNETEQIACHEDDGVGFRFDSREALTVDDNHPSKTQVDGCGDKGWSDGETDEVPNCISVAR